MAKSEVKEIIRQLKKKEIRVFDVPEEYENHIQIVTFERKSGLRITGKRGFDIISNSFFVEEELIHVDIDGEERRRSVFLSFDNFDLYFNFLNGDIYDNACYTFCRLSEDTIASRKIDLKRLMERKAFTENTIDDYSLSVSNEEKDCYENAEQIHRRCQQWVKKFNNCSSYDELVKVVSNYRKSKIAPVVNVSFFFFQYIFADIEDKQRFAIIMEYMSSGDYPQCEIINNALCSIYNPDDVMQSFNYSRGTKGTIRKHKKELEEYIHRLKEGEIKFHSKAFFDEITHYYCIEIRRYEKEYPSLPIPTIYRYFKTFEEFVKYRNGDLRYTDLSSALELDVDFSEYIIDETTKLPSHAYTEVTYSVKKLYDSGKFYVTQQWYNKSGSVIKEYEHTFDYFFDFVAFLNRDLSEADLLFCDGLMFLEQWDTINFTDTKMKSSLCEKFGLEYDIQEIKGDLIESFECIEQNENETALALQTTRDLISEAIKRDSSVWELGGYKWQRVHYISDIHIMHRIQNAECRSKEDVKYVIQKIVSTIAHEAESLLLIDGDVASDFDIFQLFVKMLSKTLRRNTMVVFTLGNHELWSFPDSSIDEIVSRYRTLLDEHGMYLLHNDVLYKEDHSLFADSHIGTHLIQYDELCEMDNTQISERLRSARYVILGGLGFSGYNVEFNADNGIYRDTIDRNIEMKESKKFEDLYNRLHCILANKNTIILTHTPKKDWCSEERYDKNLVYVSGHTHRNFFHDDGEYRIYSDNQIGYHNDNPHLKTFFIDNDYDCFTDYNDGIFEITVEQYKDFYRGKNIQMTFQHEVNALYMLKKNGYYCFIHKAKEGRLSIHNGGAIKNLEKQNIQYYYDNMDAMISTIRTPLDKYSAFQKRIADMVKRIGGYGKIHGCIIDIDFLNHIYVNPIDLSVTAYWASDMVGKIVYPSIPALLEEKCPKLFGEYVKLLEGSKENILAIKQETDTALLPQLYLDTDIYKASREIKKMQKLSSNILSFWYEDALSKKPQIEDT